jgi:hypothetical protein
MLLSSKHLGFHVGKGKVTGIIEKDGHYIVERERVFVYHCQLKQVKQVENMSTESAKEKLKGMATSQIHEYLKDIGDKFNKACDGLPTQINLIDQKWQEEQMKMTSSKN